MDTVDSGDTAVRLTFQSSEDLVGEQRRSIAVQHQIEMY